MRLYEWGVTSGPGNGPRRSPVGVTTTKTIARTRMVDALLSVPDGVVARGWVTVMGYVPSCNGYERYHTPVRAERDPAGSLHWMAGGGDE
jgi:hypothetical protein